MKEREIDALVMPRENARVAHLLSVQRATATMVDDQNTGESNPEEYDEMVITKNTETVDAFSSCVIPVKVEKVYTGGMHQCHDTSAANRRWLSATGSCHSKCIHQVEER